jgi:hypothetical protein
MDGRDCYTIRVVFGAKGRLPQYPLDPNDETS